MRITELHIYPIKSLQAVKVDTVSVRLRGFDGDRRWMLVDTHGTFLSQRSHPAMARFTVNPGRDSIGVSFPESLPILFPLSISEGTRTTVQIWDDTVEAIEGPTSVSRWFSDILGESCRVVYMPDSTYRRLDPVYGDASDAVGFADGFPILLASSGSLDELNGRLEMPLPMDRFRANIVVSGVSAWEEETWTEIRIGNLTFRSVKPCPRCVVTTTDQATGARGLEPLKTLSSYRTREGKVNFGMNLIPDGSGTISVGDAVELI